MIKPIGGMLLIKKIETGEKTTATGLVLSATFSDQGPNKATVISMGEGEYNYKGDLIPIGGINVGDVILYPEHSGTEVEDDDNTKYLLLNAKSVMAIQI
jgi:co-chaperonin GroES (HSP10)